MTKKIFVSKSDDKLIKDCIIDTFRASGKGGQHLNKTESAVRLKHIPTGLVVKCQDYRSQYRNKKKCLIQLRTKLENLQDFPVIRIPTKKPMSIKKKDLDLKRKHSIKKQLRQKPKINE